MIPLICANCSGDRLFLPGSTLACHYCQGTGTVYVDDTPITRAALDATAKIAGIKTLALSDKRATIDTQAPHQENGET